MSPRQVSFGTNQHHDAPLAASGLPPRILAVLRAAGATRLSDLCLPPPACEMLNTEDRALLHRVSSWCAATCDAVPPPLSLPEWLSLFLSPRLNDVLKLHYSLMDSPAVAAVRESTLYQTGLKLGVTRERARQLLQLALKTLRQPLPLHAAESLFQQAEQQLLAVGGGLSVSALAKLREVTWGAPSPVGTFRLLARLQPDRIVIYRDFFSPFSDRQLDRTEKALRDRLALTSGPLSIATIATYLPAAARPPGITSTEPLLLVLLRHMPDTFATCDGRAGFIDPHGIAILREILAETGEAPLRVLVDEFNRRLHPECRRGSGTMRRLLSQDPRIRKTAPNRYDLPGGLQTNLPLHID